MTERTVRTRSELKAAVSDGVETIIVEGKLAKDLAPLARIMKLSPVKIAATIGFLSVSGAAVAASIAASPATAGISGAAAFTVAAPAAAIFAAKSGISIALVIALILLCVLIGATTVIALLRTYDLCQEEIEFKIGTEGFTFRKKSTYREHSSAE